ncbi:interferon-induced GTP-binding protein Mx2 [Sigmodon hispidus]
MPHRKKKSKMVLSTEDTENHVSVSSPSDLLPNGETDLGEKNQESLNNLCMQYEEKVRPCIDLIDSLRALGVEQDLALPAIAVIGDQSSGKSSVLEALSGVALPRGSGIVTRCPLVLKLKKLNQGEEWSGKVTYDDIEVELSDPSEVEDAINKGQNCIAGTGLGISDKLISLDVSSPNVPDLTLIDLPGITRVAVGNQPKDIGHQIKRLIKTYIQKQETINLVVVPSNVDIATTEALSMAQEVDPEGDRTIGILTKPDLVDRGTEDKVVDVVRNLVYHLKKGYMIVKCRGQQDIQEQLSLTEALEKEQAFFKEHPHFSILLEDGKATVPFLAERLTTELISHICKSLPLLENQIKKCYQSTNEELQKYGIDIPEDDCGKTLFLIDKINTFNQDINAVVQGEEIVEEGECRLFTKIRDEFLRWSKDIESNFQNGYDVLYKEVWKFEKRYRGRELPGFVNYKTFENIIRSQIKVLEEPAIDMLHRVTEMVRVNFSSVSEKNFAEFFNLHRTTKSKLEDIRLEQVKEAEKMIRLHFQMEQIIYCQDELYMGALQRVSEKEAEEEKTQPNASISSQSEVLKNTSMADIFPHLYAYCQNMNLQGGFRIPSFYEQILFIIPSTFHRFKPEWSSGELRTQPRTTEVTLCEIMEGLAKIKAFLVSNEEGKCHSSEVNSPGDGKDMSKPRDQANSQESLNNLCRQYEEKVLPCIDLIDSLRALGVEQDLALPAIAVIGDQSSGKSSVLEALSGVALPRGSGIVTRFPVVLKLSRLEQGEKWSGKVTYDGIEVELSDPSHLEDAINKGQDFISGLNLEISDKLVSVDVSSPNVPDLTLIDLPGITRVAEGNPPADTGHQTKKVIETFIQKQETIIMVVVPSNMDIETTEALSISQDLDPEGDRTIGILTKPDLVDRGTEDKVVDVVRNLVYHLKKGYMIVKCRSQQDIQEQLSLTEALEKEQDFFKGHPHFSVLLEDGKATVPHFAERLTMELISHICKSLPLLENQIKKCYQSTSEELQKYGTDIPEDDCGKTLFLIDKSLPLLENQIKKCYQSTSEELQKYGTDIPEDDCGKTLFLIDKINTFNQDINAIVEEEENVEEGECDLFTKILDEFFLWNNDIESYDVLYKEVQKFENQHRGRDLPQFVNYKKIENIIKRQIMVLEKPAVDMLHRVTEMVQVAFSSVSEKYFAEFFNLHRTTKSKLEGIRLEQVKEAEKMIRLHFQMEQIIYCQDELYMGALQRVSEKEAEEEKTQPNSSISSQSEALQDSSMAEIFPHLYAYCQEAHNRISSHIPVIIQYFILKMFAEKLQKSMLQLLQDKDSCSWLLEERNDTSKKRKFLKERLSRLDQASRNLANIPG